MSHWVGSEGGEMGVARTEEVFRCVGGRILTADGQLGLNYLCPGYKKFFAPALPEIRRIVAALRPQRLHPRKRM